MGHQYGFVRERRGLLPLFVQCDARMRSHCPSRYLRAGMPTDVRGPDVRHFPATEEDAAYQDHTDVVQEIT